MGKEEFFLGRQKSWRPAEQRSEGGTHLQNDHQEKNRPYGKNSRASGLELTEASVEKAQPKSGGNDPKAEVQKTHPTDGIGAL